MPVYTWGMAGKGVPMVRPTLLYLTRDFNPPGGVATDTPRRFWAGVSRAAEQRDVNLVALVGGESNESRAQHLFDLIRAESADGYLFWASGDRARGAEISARLGDRPLVAMSVALEGRPCVVVDNKAGMYRLVCHLIEEHGRKRIAFVISYPNHNYVIERLEGYRQALAVHGIPFDPALVTEPANWEKSTGVEAVRYLLDRLGLEIGAGLDAVVCVNDRIATGVLEALAERGVEVPGEVAVTGFNNHPEALYSIPAITTVAIPFEEQAIVAATMACDMLDGKSPLALRTELAPTVSINESCGCGRSPFEVVPVLVELGLSEEEELARVKAECREILAKEGVGDAGPLADQLVAALGISLGGGSPVPLYETLRRGHILNRTVSDIEVWQKVLTAMYQAYLRTHLGRNKRQLLETFVGHGRMVALDGSLRNAALVRMGQILEIEATLEFDRQLASAASLEDIYSGLDKLLPRLRLHSFHVVLFEQGAEMSVHTYAHQRNAGGRVEIDEAPFPAWQILPPALRLQDRRFTLVVRSLVHGDIAFGYVVYDAGSEAETHHAIIADKIAASMKTVRLLESLEEKRRRLQESFDELNLAQAALVEAEKLSALGGLVAGVSHEVNTPIGVGVTASTFVMDACNDLVREIESPQPVKTRILEKIGRVRDAAEVVYANLERAAQLVDSFKQVAVDQGVDEARYFHVDAYFRAIMNSLMPAIRKAGHSLDMGPLADVEFLGFPGDISQIINNLVMNSIRHGFEDRRQGVMHLDVGVGARGDLVIHYGDNGRGMDEAVQRRMFEPFFTTKRGRGGSGLGMAVVYNLVVSKMGGTIRCTSSPGQGTQFQVTIPPCSVMESESAVVRGTEGRGQES